MILFISVPPILLSRAYHVLASAPASAACSGQRQEGETQSPNPTALLAGCACGDPRAPLAATPVSRRGFLSGGTAALGTAGSPAPPTAAQAPAKPHRIDVHHHIIPPVQA